MAPLLPNVEGSPQIVPKKLDYMLQQLGVVNTARQAAGHGINALLGNPQDPLSPVNPTAYLGLQSFLPTRSQQNAANNQAYDYRDQLQAYIKKLKSQGKYVPDYSENLRTRPSLYSIYTP